MFWKVASAEANAPEKLFYLLNSTQSFDSFSKHLDKIDVVAPAWYSVGADGVVTGHVDRRVLDLAVTHNIDVEPIVGASERGALHALLNDPKAHRLLIDQLLKTCRTYHFGGFQLDFENIALTDRNALSAMVREVAQVFHTNHLIFSIAVVPSAPGYPGEGKFSRWMWDYWRGAYDMKALGQVVDFISLMTYDQNMRWTTPGPVGGWDWMVKNVNYTIRFVPAHKISLGIPLYGYHWSTGNPVRPDKSEAPNITVDYIDADEWIPLAKRSGALIQWASSAHEAFFWFERDDLREWVFVPNARSTKERYDFAVERGLRWYICVGAWGRGA
ncbi:glycosyl hydrolase family 18 protein [Gluconobacter cerinus]|nr:glycosyl hydrolase family 18 protein [Gluconobacter cerinus]